MRSDPQMACKHVKNFIFGEKYFKSRVIHQRQLCYNSRGEESHDQEEDILPSEWYEKAFSKMMKWRHTLKEVDLIGGRLVNVNDHSRVFDDKLEHKLHTFKSIARIFIGLPSMQETIRKNMVTSFANTQYTEFQCFSKRREREPLSVNSLTKVADIMSISAQQRKVVRHTICPQVTQHKIWNGALEEILNRLKSEINVLMHRHPSKEIRLSHQIVINCLKILQTAISYDHESTSWMRLKPTKGEDSSPSPKWEDVLEMSIDLINCLSEEKELTFHILKLEAMKEGLYQIKDVLMDKNIGYKETRYQEHLVQKRLTKTLGHSSKCLYTLLLYYLYGSVGDIEVDVRGGVHVVGRGSKVCLYMGKILTSDEENVVLNGLKELDRALGLFKFVWEASGTKGDFEVQGHLWCVGAENISVQYRGNVYLIHGIHL